MELIRTWSCINLYIKRRTIKIYFFKKVSLSIKFLFKKGLQLCDNIKGTKQFSTNLL